MYLNTHTYFSLRYGTLSVKDLVDMAQRLGLKSLALTDINNTSCTTEFIGRCQAAGIKPLIGIEYREAGQFLYIGIAKNRRGFEQLNALLSHHSIEQKPLPKGAPPMPDTFIIYRKDQVPKKLESLRANEFIGICPHELNTLYNSKLNQYQEKLVMLCSVTFLDDSGYHTHTLLRAIDENTVLSKVNKDHMAHPSERFGKPKTILKLFRNLYPQIVENTGRLIGACSIDWPTGLQNNRRSFTGSKAGDLSLLKKLAYKGAQMRYEVFDAKIEQRLRKELALIEQMDFGAYFLITWDIIRYAQSMDMRHVGRGSGANSIVAYCLGITDVDPLDLDLYFERFINPHRVSPPDFDIDFSWDERDDVIDYVFKRYGFKHTALLATYNTFQLRSVVRELGKVYGLPKADIDLILNAPEATDRHHDLAKEIMAYGRKMEGFPNYLSIHAGGILISEEPIFGFTALQQMPKGFPIVHFDMHHAEDLGFHKYDVLSQRGLGHIKDAVALVESNSGQAVPIDKIDMIKEDPKTKKMLQSGNCMGCFYIESPAMRGLLKKLSCDDYIHLVAASSIIRPGVSSSGMMREYITRFHNPFGFDHIHETFREHLGETYGVMVYQEDVMKILHHFAGMDLSDSDVLRRLMSGKRKHSDSFEQLKAKYFSNCKALGHSKELSQEVWRQIISFGGYSFCKAHSASFAVESFQSLYLKAYHPLEFMVAVINNFGGFYKTEYYFRELEKLGATLHPPCINNSTRLTTIQGANVYIGFINLQQMEAKTVDRIVAERRKRGAFTDLENFVNRVEIGGEQLDILIRIGAFRFTQATKYELMWEKNAVFNPQKKYEASTNLFENQAQTYSLPLLETSPDDQAFDELELLGFMLCNPFSLLEKQPETILQKDFAKLLGKKVSITGYYVCEKHTRTKHRDRMSFATWLDAEGCFFDTTHFPKVVQAHPLRGRACYTITGKVISDFGFLTIDVFSLERLPYRKDMRYN